MIKFYFLTIKRLNKWRPKHLEKKSKIEQKNYQIERIFTTEKKKKADKKIGLKFSEPIQITLMTVQIRTKCMPYNLKIC